MTDKKKAILESLKGGLIVSCQVQHDDPVYSEDFVLKMANAAEWAGAVGIRANSPEQIRLIKEHVKLLWTVRHRLPMKEDLRMSYFRS